METLKRNTGANSKRRLHQKRHWTPDEDYLLIMLVKKHGAGKWDFIAQHIEGRTGKSCRLRWINQLNPKVDKTPFSQEEQQRLFELHRKIGNKWSTIVSFFPGRTDNHVKNQYHALVGSRHMKTSTPSSITDPRGQLKIGSVDSSRHGSISTVAVGSQFSNFSYQGNNYFGFAPCFGVNPDRIENTPLPDANSAAFSELCPVLQPQQGVGTNDYQFIDFLGVGSSE